MTIATPTQSYATNLEADAYLVLNDNWLDLDILTKDDALLWARYFIDANFDIIVDYSAIKEEVKYANSLLAYDYFIQGDLFFDNKKNVKSKKVVAGSVEVETNYGYSMSETPNSLSKVKAILLPIGNYVKQKLVRV